MPYTSLSAHGKKSLPHLNGAGINSYE